MLYKYVGNVDDDKTIEYLDAFVDKGTIYASRPSNFNDPAELKLIFDYNAELSVIKQRFHQTRPERTEQEFWEWYKSFDENSRAGVRLVHKYINLSHRNTSLDMLVIKYKATRKRVVLTDTRIRRMSTFLQTNITSCKIQL